MGQVFSLSLSVKLVVLPTTVGICSNLQHEASRHATSLCTSDRLRAFSGLNVFTITLSASVTSRHLIVLFFCVLSSLHIGCGFVDTVGGV